MVNYQLSVSERQRQFLALSGQLPAQCHMIGNRLKNILMEIKKKTKKGKEELKWLGLSTAQSPLPKVHRNSEFASNELQSCLWHCGDTEGSSH